MGEGEISVGRRRIDVIGSISQVVLDAPLVGVLVRKRLRHDTDSSTPLDGRTL